MTSPRDLANGAPWWLKQAFGPGLAIFLLLWLLGLLPFLPNPIWTQVLTAIGAQAEATQKQLGANERNIQELLRVQRLTCAAAWKTEPAVQRECWRAEP